MNQKGQKVLQMSLKIFKNVYKWVKNDIKGLHGEKVENG